MAFVTSPNSVSSSTHSSSIRMWVARRFFFLRRTLRSFLSIPPAPSSSPAAVFDATEDALVLRAFFAMGGRVRRCVPFDIRPNYDIECPTKSYAIVYSPFPRRMCKTTLDVSWIDLANVQIQRVHHSSSRIRMIERDTVEISLSPVHLASTVDPWTRRCEYRLHNPREVLDALNNDSRSGLQIYD